MEPPSNAPPIIVRGFDTWATPEIVIVGGKVIRQPTPKEGAD